MLEDLAQSLSRAVRLIGSLSASNAVIQDAELLRLQQLCARLLTTVSAHQIHVPSAITSFCESPSAKGWSDLQGAVSVLGTNVGRMFTLLKREEGDFVINGHETYRSLVLGLSERARIYEEIQEMSYPPAVEDLNCLRKIATDYEGLLESLRMSLSEIAAYVRERRGQPATPEKHSVSEWYISYAWGDESTPEGRARKEIVEQLCQAAATQGYKILRDKEVLRVGDSISAFMQRIGTGSRIFVILSEKYLRSPYCMFELSEIWRTSRQEGKAFLERVRIYALPDANIFTPADWADWAIYWKQEYDTLEKRAREHGLFVIGELGNQRLKQMRTFYNEVADILGTLADTVQPRTLQDFQRYGFNDKLGGEKRG
jgi:TIR domain